MSAFEFFFSFYGLLLGLSVAVIATGAARAFQHRKRLRIGWLTPLLAVFVALDIATFWEAAWTNFRHLPFSYGLLVGGLAIAVVYFIAAALVFPEPIEDGASLDDHFWDNKKTVLLLLVLANLLGILAALWANSGREHGMALTVAYAGNFAVYLVLILPAAFARKPRLFAAGVGLHIVIYLAIAVLTAMRPHAVIDEQGRVVARGAPANDAPSVLPKAPAAK